MVYPLHTDCHKENYLALGLCPFVYFMRKAQEFKIVLGGKAPCFSFFSEPNEMKWIKFAGNATELYNPRKDINGCSKNLIKF